MKPNLIFIWHVSFPNYEQRMCMMAMNAAHALKLCESLELV